MVLEAQPNLQPGLSCDSYTCFQMSDDQDTLYH